MLPPKNIALMVIACALSSGAALAKLPPPSEEAKAKAEEAKAKAAHGGKVAAFQLCNSMDKVAQRYLKDNKGKSGKPLETPKCQDPGPFQMASSAPAAPPAAPAAAPAPAPAKK
ncbi:MAG: formate dehydrogenase [Sterolibacterium sp.]|jgi:hypothetical protein